MGLKGTVLFICIKGIALLAIGIMSPDYSAIEKQYFINIYNFNGGKGGNMKRSIIVILGSILFFALSVPFSQAATISLVNGSEDYISVSVTRQTFSGNVDTVEGILAWPMMTDRWYDPAYKVQKMEVWLNTQTSGKRKELKRTKLLSTHVPEQSEFGSEYTIRVDPQLTVTYD